ncbi:hypothetical protein BAXH7_02284 [Bacillus amyloliquefaciens XH7]|nr:hypothetical protein LL3_01292 [Bacillus amyloliquefaciens LL3]AEK89414.1 hypothetical protein BAXH7_02284 [Bacillus amyloliquefaciens XH7]KYC97995.1 hypothetical protein B425_1298 [Bacillus amyloliquefaciens]
MFDITYAHVVRSFRSSENNKTLTLTPNHYVDGPIIDVA